LSTAICGCGRTISGNKTKCRACADRPSGVLEILNVGAGDVKITFEKENVSESIRAKRVIQDMLRRGFALVVEVERDGKTAYERVQEFDAARGEYIIADFDSLEAAKVDAEQEIPDEVVNELSRPDALPHLAGATEENKLCACGRPARHRGICKGTTHRQSRERRLSMETTKATGIGRSAGG